MSVVKIIYGSTTGNTEEAAEKIAEHLKNVTDSVTHVEDVTVKDFNNSDVLILGISTWDVGGLQYDWEDFFDELDKVDFSKKVVALFGMGDQRVYNTTFQDAMGTLYQKVTSCGAIVIGSWPTVGYEFKKSKGVVDGNFVGLALDNDNQGNQTNARIEKWTTKLKQDIENLQASLPLVSECSQ